MIEGRRFVTRTLMCRDHEVCTFTYDLGSRSIVGRVKAIERRYMPLAAQTPDGAFDGGRLSSWVSARAIPSSRANVSALLDALGIGSTEELMFCGLGLSLSDQYWLRPNGLDAGWDDVNAYDRDFPGEVGAALVPRGASSLAAAVEGIAKDAVALRTSPDTALNGNLPKFWESVGGEARLYKSGKQQNLMLEPFCEVAATVVCSSILAPGMYVPYRLDDADAASPLGSCPAFTDDRTEFVPAGDVFHLAPRDNSLSHYERYARLLEGRGLADVRLRLSEMLAVDHVIGNFDRHWGNFGVLVDTETREWLRVAPLFDMGESFDCDRALAASFAPRRNRYRCPFLTRVDDQMGRYAEDLSWFDGAAALAAAERALAGVCSAPLIASVAERYAEVEADRMRAAVARVEKRATALVGAALPTGHISIPVPEEEPCAGARGGDARPF